MSYIKTKKHERAMRELKVHFNQKIAKLDHDIRHLRKKLRRMERVVDKHPDDDEAETTSEEEDEDKSTTSGEKCSSEDDDDDSGYST